MAFVQKRQQLQEFFVTIITAVVPGDWLQFSSAINLCKKFKQEADEENRFFKQSHAN